MTLSQSKVDLIVNLFSRGHSLDRVSEWGLLYGWNREQVKALLREKGWALDWSGRLLPRFLPRAIGGTPPRSWSVSADADTDRLLEAGIDHQEVAIRRLAVKAQSAIDALRVEMVRYEEIQAREVERSRGSSYPQDATS